MRDLDPSVQNATFNVFLCRSQKDASESKINPPATFALASFYINGYGTEPHHEEAARLLLHAAKWGHHLSKAYVYRICHALDDQFSATESVITDLVTMSLSGSRLALHDLEEVAPDKVPFVKTSLKDFLAGTGANFFYLDQMLHGPLRGYWADIFSSRALLAEKLDKMNVQDFRLNKRGDRLLHVAASCGNQNAVEIMLTSYTVDVNQCNDQGETALLCACRAGQVEMAHLLLSRGADASITTESKESPLHWLISFSSDDIETLGATLIASGADVRIITNKDVSYSVFPSGIDVDHFTPGTPLDWAVHHDRPDIVKFFLESAGDPRICLIKASDPRPTAPLWAAHYHHTECLKLMVEALEASNVIYIYGPMLAAAAHSADLFSMILRHGSEYKVRLKATLDYLLVKSKNTYFSTGIGSFGHTLLYDAVREAHDAVVEYLLSPETQKLLGLPQSNTVSLQPDSTELESTVKPNVGDIPGAFKPEDVNLACGFEKRTPLLESVRWNRRPLFQMLSEHGADARATSRNPFTKDRMDWTGLHIFAYAGHNSDFRLVHDLVRAGVPVDGRSAGSTETQTPLAVAIQNNAFELASTLIRIGADINAQSLSSGLIAGDYPLTILGQIIASTTRYSTPRLRYMLFECAVHSEVNFIVEPERSFTALHRAAWAYHGLFATSPDSDELKPICREDCDMTTNRDIIYELLQRFNTPEQLNMRCQALGRTALHLAVDTANVGGLKELVDRGADKEALDDLGETPASLAERLLLSKEDRDWREEEMKEILRILRS